MRIWNVPVRLLDRQRLLSEHVELHTIYSVIINRKRGYSRHPEVNRWRPCLAALCARHEAQVAEMTSRGYNHRSPLAPLIGEHSAEWPAPLEPIEDELEILNQKQGTTYRVSDVRPTEGERHGI